ncbi:MOSC domain-containing protein [Bradyrhizobium sp. ISRA443]|uniref:MOSC domain-containing protein n=1 Tax=unclassified Bradyrhizobium TaxID=2631580 RepID=UPI0024799C78|nr:MULTISPECIES: MOSC domain-containing protein [unclassified Bradyrhizobium]WGS00067.1 MOSC domain-containing protein [Bradyrhizobium sp. ISRA436]WGS06956.1 MOSC domain-containing protein [Bradyrhizobium sp. ISRA437]WGS13838.1 MOSC domain-containing protein [Bradyrhizobium sp. ISRA443]
MDNTRTSSARIAGIYRYPVKGLTPEPLPHAELKAGHTLRSDRRYAIENGPSGFDPAAPKWLPKPHFLMLQRDEWLAPLRAHFDDDSHVLTLRRDGAMVAQGDLETAAGRAAIERYFAGHHAGVIKGPPKVLASPGHSFSDVARKVVSIINLASLRAIESMVQAAVHPLRFRANLYVEGWPAWHEASLLDQTIAIGSARAKVVKRITRCAAVNVDPETGVRDLTIPQTLMQRFGHNECGVYAEIIADGSVAVNDTIAAERSTLV